jgi:hypothetical protein
MSSAPKDLETRSARAIRALEAEIVALEAELRQVEGQINAFEARIRAQLHSEIVRIRELTELYKKQKLAKRAQRLEQKKRGKNYREPPPAPPTENRAPRKSSVAQLERKRLYREAVVHVHPDKFATDADETARRATEITSRLNELYRSGDLEELKDFHEHIISGNAMAHAASPATPAGNPDTMVAFLQKQKQKLATSLEAARGSPLCEALREGRDPTAFIAEVREDFLLRIRQLERRTRSKSGSR